MYGLNIFEPAIFGSQLFFFNLEFWYYFWQVSEFIQSLPGCEEHGKVFKDEQIDGEAFLLMTQTDIVKIMSIKLGPALKIFNSILMFKAAEKNSHNELWRRWILAPLASAL